MCLHQIYLPKQRLNVDCGTCPSCLKKRRGTWVLRMRHEQEYYEKSVFLTLTYANEYVPVNGSLLKSDYQLFVKRLRKQFSFLKLKIFLCGEYGDKTARPHYHFIIFGLDLADLECYRQSGKWVSALVDDLWLYGFNSAGNVTPKSISYVASYCEKKLFKQKRKEVYEKTGRIPPFSQASNGIGLQWALSHAEFLKRELCCYVGKIKHAIPRYYRKKLGIDASYYQESIKEFMFKEYKAYYDATGDIDIYIPDDDVISVSDDKMFYITLDRRVIHVDFPLRRYDGYGFLTDRFLRWRKECSVQYNKDIVARLSQQVVVF